jgi:hypothetical protein
MPTEALRFGMPWIMLAGIPYALPPCKATLFTDAVGPTITQSNTLAFVNSVAVTLTGGMATLSGGFIKCTTAILVTIDRD